MLKGQPNGDITRSTQELEADVSNIMNTFDGKLLSSYFVGS